MRLRAGATPLFLVSCLLGLAQILYAQQHDSPFLLEGRSLAAAVFQAPRGKPEMTIGDEERSAITCTSFDLDIHLQPSDGGLSAVARVQIRNDGTKALPVIALQLSSSLHWEGVSQVQDQRTEKLQFDAHLLQSDADQSGEISEAVVRLREPLAVGATAELTLIYSGHVPNSPSAGEGLSSSSATQADLSLSWPDGIFLRGYGHVLWYPVASPQTFLGEGASLARTSGEQMLRQAKSKVRLRLSVEYTGSASQVAIFCGREQPLNAWADTSGNAVSKASGIATAELPWAELGFRPLSLLITRAPVPLPGDTLALVPGQSDRAAELSAAASAVKGMLDEWLGVRPSRPVIVVDRPGALFADTGLLVAPLGQTSPQTMETDLVPVLTRTRFPSSQAWLERGTAQFAALLWLERTQGRPELLNLLADTSRALALAESVSPSPSHMRESLLHTGEAAFYRDKAAAVLWMLRTLASDAALKRTFQSYEGDVKLDQDPLGFERLLEHLSGKNLDWFFQDWVYHDRGLPDLSIVSATARALPAKTAIDAGRLVAVEVRNDGGAAAEVPVTVRSGTLTATERLRINAHTVGSVRVLFQGQPEEVQVNDGTVPEMLTSTHVHTIHLD